MWWDRKFFFLHDNARLHTAAIPAVFGQKRSGAVESPSIFARFKPLRLFRFPKIKIGPQRWPLCFNRRHSEICNCKIKSVPNFWLCVSYETPRKSHQRVYSSVRRRFQINITCLNFLHFFSPFSQRCLKTYPIHLVYTFFLFFFFFLISAPLAAQHPWAFYPVCPWG